MRDLACQPRHARLPGIDGNYLRGWAAALRELYRQKTGSGAHVEHGDSRLDGKPFEEKEPERRCPQGKLVVQLPKSCGGVVDLLEILQGSHHRNLFGPLEVTRAKASRICSAPPEAARPGAGRVR